MRKVLIDAQILASQRRGGISRYYVELIKNSNVFLEHDLELMVPYRLVVNEHAVEEIPSRFKRLRAGQQVGRALRAARVAQHKVLTSSIVHHTHYDPRYLSSSPKRRVVSTVYDMIPEIFPEQFPGGSPHKAKRRFIDASDVVIAISERTKQDVVEIYGIDAARIVVVPLGVDDAFTKSVTPVKLDRPTFLFVGGRAGYKNFDCVISALAIGRRRICDLELVAVGGGPFQSEEMDRMRTLGITSSVRQTTADNNQLIKLYQSATAFVFPSKYEGFGLPTLEAMACGCPTVLARAGALPEVGGPAALYFDPDDPEELADHLCRLVEDEQAAADLSLAGRTRVTAFGWERTAHGTARIYADL